MRFFCILVYTGLAVVLCLVAVAGSSCGSNQKGLKVELEPEQVSDEKGFVRYSPNQDANAIVHRGVFVSPPCEECADGLGEIIAEFMGDMLEAMAEGSIKGFFGRN